LQVFERELADRDREITSFKDSIHSLEVKLETKELEVRNAELKYE
jgi:hypothetical protein